MRHRHPCSGRRRPGGIVVFGVLSSDHFSYKNVRLGRIIETFRVELMTFASVTEYFGKSEHCFLPSAYPFGEGVSKRIYANLFRCASVSACCVCCAGKSAALRSQTLSGEQQGLYNHILLLCSCNICCTAPQTHAAKKTKSGAQTCCVARRVY